MNDRLILGLDIGTNSIGWALVKEEDGKPTGFVDAGSRIIPMKPDHKEEFEKGNKITKNAVRRMKRQSRRQRGRYKLRRERLIRTMKILGIIPETFDIHDSAVNKLALSAESMQEFESLFNPVGPKDHDKVVWFLRQKGLSQKLTPAELGRVLYHFNQRRGFQSSRKTEITDSDTNKPRSVKSFEEVVIRSVIETGDSFKGRKEYEIELADGRISKSTNTLFLQAEGQNIQLIINQTTKKSGEISYTFTIPDEDSWTYRMEELNRQIGESKQHPGSFFLSKLLADPTFRVKDNIVQRKFYKAELRDLLESQMQHHRFLSDPVLLEKVVTELYPSNQDRQRVLKRRDLAYLLLEDIIYYQRPLKSQRNSISDCRFEKRIDQDKSGIPKEYTVKVCPKSAPIFQEFRIWQQINNLKIENENYEDITDLVLGSIRDSLYKLFDSRAEIKGSKLKLEISRLAGIPKEKIFLSIREDQTLIGNTTKNDIRKVLDSFGFDSQDLFNDQQKMEMLWHILYSLDQNEHVVNALLTPKTVVELVSDNERLIEKRRKIQFGFTEEIANALAKKVRFKPEYGAFSAKALKKLVPLMRSGSYFSEEGLFKNVRNKIEKVITGEFDSEIDPLVYEIFQNRRSVGDFNGLKFWEACTLVYGTHTINQVVSYQKPQEIGPLKRGSLRNPIVEQLVNETLQVVKAIWEQPDMGRPDEIRVELARELKSSAKDRKSIYDGGIKRKIENDRIKTEIINHFPHIPNPSSSDIERYRLWEESAQKCLYSGKVINKSMIFDKGLVDVDHIIPKSRFFDDSYANKIICLTEENRKKGNSTAFEYMNSKGEDEFNRFREMIKSNRNYSGRKRTLLLTTEIPDDFVERQKKDTQYIAVRTRLELQKIVPTVVTTTGSVTDYLRHQWGINELLKRETLPRFLALQEKSGVPIVSEVTDESGRRRLEIKEWSKRYDNRAHAIDAMIIACTSAKHINFLNRLSAQVDKEETIRVGGKKISRQEFLKEVENPKPMPWPGFLDDLKSVFNRIVVSYKNRKRLVTYADHSTMALDKTTGKYVKKLHAKKAVVIREPLHEETLYGIIKTREESYVGIKDFFAEPALFMIRDRSVRMALADLLQQAGNDPEKAMKLYNREPMIDPVTRDKIKKVSCYRLIPTYVYRVSLDVNLTAKKISNIVDRAVKKQVEDHVVNFGTIKKAFSAEGLAEFNRLRKIHGFPPIQSVRIKAGESDEEDSGAKVRIREEYHKSEPGGRGKLAVKPGNNYCVVVYVNQETQKRHYHTLSFFDAVQLKLNGLPLAEPKDGHTVFSIKHYDLVYVPLTGENVDTIDWKDRTHLAKRIYRVVKYGQDSRVYFMPHTFASQFYVRDANDKLVGDFKNAAATSDPNGSEFFMEPDGSRQKIMDVLIKIKTDRLGRSFSPVVEEVVR